MKTALFKHTLGLLFVIGVLEIISTIFYLHWTLWWFDVILHFLGGAWAAMTILLIWHNGSSLLKPSRLKIVWIGVIGAFIIGFMWEIYELLIGATAFGDGIFYWRDTYSDLIMDVCGGFFASLYSYKILSKNG